MRLATIIAAWVLALYATGYGLLLLMFLSAAAALGWPVLLLFTAGAAIYAAVQAPRLLNGARFGSDLMVALLLFGAALFFGLMSSEAFLDQHVSWKEVFLSIGMAGLPTILSIWIGGVYAVSGVRALSAGRGKA